jgi:hypothetical protein
MGTKVEILLGAWSDMRQALNEGTIDVPQSISCSAERARLVDFSPLRRQNHGCNSFSL